MASCSTCSRCDRYSISSFAALLLLANCQIPQKYGRCGTRRPTGPRGLGKVQQSWATCGASRLATAQADGGFQINAALPEIKARLLEASSHWTASDGMNFTIFWQYSIAAITLSDPIVMSPLAFTRSAPKAPNVAPQVWLASVLFWPQPKPMGYPALNMASAILSCIS